LFQDGFVGSAKWFRRQEIIGKGGQPVGARLQAELTAKGVVFNKPDPVQFRAALVKAGFYTQWQKTYCSEAWRGWSSIRAR
jgi:hypothetical protein